jgi:hypothetical protein
MYRRRVDDRAPKTEATSRSITDVTKRNIFDAIRLGNVRWWGDIDEVDFLNRIYDLSAMESADFRHPTAEGDIIRHRRANYDWEDDWVFTDARFQLDRGPDEVFLRFVCEMLHPAVRRDPEEVTRLRDMLNEHLRRDGWEIHALSAISGYPVYAARRLALSRGRAVAALRNVAAVIGAAEHIAQQITRIEASVDADPALAIGTAKELIETVCKSILAERDVPGAEEWDVPRLVKETTKLLQLTPEGIDKAVKGADSIRRILGSLGSIAGGLAELRNLYGTGHGKSAAARGLGARHAHLAVGAATTLVVFLYETHLARGKDAASD